MVNRYSYNHGDYDREEEVKVEKKDTQKQTEVKFTRPSKPSTMDRETAQILTDDQVQTGG